MAEFQKVRCKLVGTDGNIFALIARSCEALRSAGFYEKAVELRKRILVDEEAESYDAALMIILEYIEEGGDE